MTNLTYRPDIDGLRAIAVLGVIFYHARLVVGQTYLISGGFIGVDVFFVISGYLITSILLRDFQAGTFSLLRFYERRARRILPALFLMMFATAPFALLLMEPLALKEFASSAIAALGFISNIWFWREDTYAAEPSAFKPLLHTWSLSVEEQFYVLYPAAIFGLWFFRHHLSARFLSIALFIGLLLSLLLADYGSRHFANGTFFLLPTRGWELLAGALLATGELRRREQQLPGTFDSMLAAAGLLAVLASLLLFDDNMRHPSFITVVPVLGTVLLIRYGRAPGVANRLVSSRPMVATGLLSYSLYLWHFPVLALARVAGADMTLLTTILLLLVAVVLAWLSYHLVEKPARNPNLVATKTLVSALTGSALLLGGIFILLYLHARNELRNFRINDSLFDISIEMQKRTERIDENCSSWLSRFCSRPEAAKVNILVVGDSMAVDVVNMLGPQYPDYRFVLNDLGGCPPAPDIAKLVRPDHPDLERCKQLNKARFAEGSIAGFDGVIINNHMDWYTAEDLRPYLDFLSNAGMQKVLIVGNFLRLDRDFTEIILEQGSKTFAYPILEASGHSQKALETKELQSLAGEYGYKVLDLAAYACANDDCELFVGDYPFSWDRFHLSVEFAEYLGEKMKPDLAGTWLEGLSESRP